MTKLPELSTHEAYLSLEGMEGIPFAPEGIVAVKPWWVRTREQAVAIYPGLLATLTIAAAATTSSP